MGKYKHHSRAFNVGVVDVCPGEREAKARAWLEAVLFAKMPEMQDRGAGLIWLERMFHVPQA